jgi:hypothetical protein
MSFALTGIHMFAYQVGNKSINTPYFVPAVLAITLTVTIQLIGYRRRRRSLRGLKDLDGTTRGWQDSLLVGDDGVGMRAEAEVISRRSSPQKSMPTDTTN